MTAVNVTRYSTGVKDKREAAKSQPITVAFEGRMTKLTEPRMVVSGVGPRIFRMRVSLEWKFHWATGRTEDS